MTKVMIALGASAAMAAAGLALAPVPAAAQQSSAEVTVYGTDPCPRSTATGAILVCRHRPETERYRLPQNQRMMGARQERQSWANKAQDLAATGNTGTMSCSAVGPGGHTGCLIQEIKRSKQEAREATEQQTAPDQ